MDTRQLMDALGEVVRGKGLRYYVGAADTLVDEIEFVKYPILAIQNIDVHTGEGIHWIAWFILSETEAEVFDSYGRPLKSYPNVRPLVPNIVKQNSIDLQNDYSYVCGQYCIMFLAYRSCGITFDNFLLNFTSCSMYNDYGVQTFVKGMYNPVCKQVDRKTPFRCIQRKK